MAPQSPTAMVLADGIGDGTGAEDLSSLFAISVFYPGNAKPPLGTICPSAVCQRPENQEELGLRGSREDDGEFAPGAAPWWAAACRSLPVLPPSRRGPVIRRQKIPAPHPRNARFHASNSQTAPETDCRTGGPVP